MSRPVSDAHSKSARARRLSAKSFVRPLILLALIVFVFVWKQELIFSALDKIRTMHAGVVALCVACSVGFQLLDGCAISRVAGCGYGTGVCASFFCAFYKLATLGSANGAAEIYFLSKHGVPASKGTGAAMLQYALQKTTLTLWGLCAFAFLSLAKNPLVKKYAAFVAAGTGISLAIVTALVLLCVSEPFSCLLIFLTDRIFKKNEARAARIREQILLFTQNGKATAKDGKTVAFVLCADTLKYALWFLIPALVFGTKANYSIVQIVALTALSVMLSGVMVAPRRNRHARICVLAVFHRRIRLAFCSGTHRLPILYDGVPLPARHPDCAGTQ